MPTFRPPLSTSTSFPIVPSNPHVTLDFDANFAQDEDRSGSWEIWTDINSLKEDGTPKHGEGEWHAITFTPRPSSDYVLRAEVLTPAEVGKSWSYTYRRVFPDGFVDWLGGPGSNGEIKVVQGEEEPVNVAPVVEAEQVKEEQSEETKVETVEEDKVEEPQHVETITLAPSADVEYTSDAKEESGTDSRVEETREEAPDVEYQRVVEKQEDSAVEDESAKKEEIEDSPAIEEEPVSQRSASDETAVPDATTVQNTAPTTKGERHTPDDAPQDAPILQICPTPFIDKIPATNDKIASRLQDDTTPTPGATNSSESSEAFSSDATDTTPELEETELPETHISTSKQPQPVTQSQELVTFFSLFKAFGHFLANIWSWFFSTAQVKAKKVQHEGEVDDDETEVHTPVNERTPLLRTPGFSETASSPGSTSPTTPSLPSKTFDGLPSIDHLTRLIQGEDGSKQGAKL